MLRPIFGCSTKRVHRLKKAAGIYSIRYKAYKVTTNSKHAHPVAPNLIGRKFKASKRNQVWTSDITYVATGEGLVAAQKARCCSTMHPGWLYFAVIKDLFTKKVVGYAYSERINTQLCLDALDMAVYRQRPKAGLIFHCDRGVQYAGVAFRQALFRYGFLQSMSRKGGPYDNAVAENYFSCLKCECVYLNHFATHSAAKITIFHYIETFYNRVRPHSGIGWLAPSIFERMLSDNIKSFVETLHIAV